MVTVAITTQSSDDVIACLDTRYWFYFLASSLIVFFAGVIVILTWRIAEHFIGCGWTAAVTGNSRTQNTPSESTVANRWQKIAAKIKWKCEKLVSAQTLFGRIVVSSITYQLSINSY